MVQRLWEERVKLYGIRKELKEKKEEEVVVVVVVEGVEG